jgi:ubiquinone/menaquinone biosynthesis C-methylase UbiE
MQLEPTFSSLGASSIEFPPLDLSERMQEAQYARIASEYDAHYSDPWSTEYRRRFIYASMFEGIELAGRKVLDAMCGSGQTTEHLSSGNAEVTGLDLSSVEIHKFRSRWPNATAVCRSLLDCGLDDESFDCVAIVGGLHHVQPHVSRAVREIHRVLKPGGIFCFMEPHSSSLPDLVRKVWYKHDHYFSDNEASINLEHLEQEFASQFRIRKVAYGGNLAFLLVLNSLIFRIPVRFKHLYSPLLVRLESVINRFQGKKTSCFVVAQWEKI